MNKKVSIIVPVYNVEKYVEQCINSIINQTYNEIEIILIDDGSKDGSGRIIDKYTNIDKRCRIIHKENEGYGRTCNLGIRMATGDFLSIVEPDDFLEQTFIEDLLENALKFSSDIVKCEYKELVVSKNETKIIKHYDKMPSSTCLNNEQKSFFLQCHPSIWTCLYSMDFIKKRGILFQEINGSAWVDNLFQIKTILLCKSMVFLNKSLYIYRINTEDPADDLKNWQWPFDRSDEINCWIDQNQSIITETAIKSVYYRELCYIKIGMRSRCDDSSDLICRAKGLATFLLNRNVGHNYFSYKDVAYLNRVVKKGWLERGYSIMKKKINILFKIHLTKREKTITLFGITFIHKNSEMVVL